MADFEIKKGSTKRSIEAALESLNKNDDYSDVTGVSFYMRSTKGTVNKVDGTAGTFTIDPLVKYRVTAKYTFVAADVDTPGTYQVYFKATFAAGKTDRFPSTGYKTLLVTDDFE